MDKRDEVMRRLKDSRKVLQQAQKKVVGLREIIDFQKLPTEISLNENPENVISELLEIRNFLHQFCKIVDDLREEVITARIAIEKRFSKR